LIILFKKKTLKIISGIVFRRLAIFTFPDVFCALCQSIVNDINDKFSDELAMEENEENQDDIDDSWDFKRR
jgi:hypothetical protein